MQRDQIEKESRRWVEAAIISEEQRDKILAHYEKKPVHSLLFIFAAIFIGLGFLTFIASNWSAIPDLVRMAILIITMVLSYLAGGHIYLHRSKRLGISLMVIGVFIFGAGIFLTGQMYNFMSFSAFPFFIWGVAAFLLYVLIQDRILFVTAAAIMTVGQLYSGLVFQQFDLWIGILFLLGLGYFVYVKKEEWLSVVFAVSFIFQAIVLVFGEGFPYYWLIVYFLLLYLADDLVLSETRLRSFKLLSLSAMFVLNTIQVFILTNEYIFERIEYSFYFFIVWAALFVYAVIRSAMSSANLYWIDLILFVPVFRFEFGDTMSLVVLFLYSLGWLWAGYRNEVRRWVNKGTFTFLVTTVMAYFQLAWDFMSRSLFFFIGGVILFLLSFLLERKRRNMQKGGTST